MDCPCRTIRAHNENTSRRQFNNGYSRKLLPRGGCKSADLAGFHLHLRRIQEAGWNYSLHSARWRKFLDSERKPSTSSRNKLVPALQQKTRKTEIPAKDRRKQHHNGADNDIVQCLRSYFRDERGNHSLRNNIRTASNINGIRFYHRTLPRICGCASWFCWSNLQSVHNWNCSGNV